MAETTKNRPVSRAERALTEEQALGIVHAVPHCVLSTCDAAGIPYGMPVTPVLLDGSLYFHGTARPESRRRENLLVNPEVSLCFVAKDETLPEQYSVDYASAIVAGRAHLVTDEAEREKAIRAIIARHAPGNDPMANENTISHALPATQIWRVEIESVTGKARCGAKGWKA